jgi:hypothetical protein
MGFGNVWLIEELIPMAVGFTLFCSEIISFFGSP